MPDNPQIIAPRVPLVDVNTGLVSREWFRFFASLNSSAQNVVNLDELTAAISAAVTDLSIVPTAEYGVNEALATAISNLVDVAGQTSAIREELANAISNIQALGVAPANTPQLHRKAYGSFYDVTDQTAAAINTAYAMAFGNTDYSLGVYTGSPTSQVYVDRPGLYNIQFSAQLDKTSASLGNVWIWLDKNGSTVANTGTQVSLQGSSAATVAAWNFLLEMNAGDYFRLMWSTDDTACFIKHVAAAAPVPVIPSVILTVTNNINDNTPY